MSSHLFVYCSRLYFSQPSDCFRIKEIMTKASYSLQRLLVLSHAFTTNVWVTKINKTLFPCSQGYQLAHAPPNPSNRTTNLLCQFQTVCLIIRENGRFGLQQPFRWSTETVDLSITTIVSSNSLTIVRHTYFRQRRFSLTMQHPCLQNPSRITEFV